MTPARAVDLWPVTQEMDDEEYSYAALQEPLYRLETGNYEYRLILRCRQQGRARSVRGGKLRIPADSTLPTAGARQVSPRRETTNTG